MCGRNLAFKCSLISLIRMDFFFFLLAPFTVIFVNMPQSKIFQLKWLLTFSFPLKEKAAFIDIASVKKEQLTRLV